jgi:RND family efflux transporter MFP subunit
MNDGLPKKARWFRPGLLVALAIVVGLLALIRLRFKEAVSEKAALAEAMTVSAAKASEQKGVVTVHGTQTTWQPAIPITGTLAPIRESTVSFKVTGRLSGVYVKVGDVVKSGNRLASLDPIDASAQIAGATAQVRAAGVDLAIAKENERRSSVLLEKNSISSAEHLGDEQKVQVATARFEQAKAQAEMAKVALQNTQLVAPFAGVVTLAPSAPGAIVTPGSSLFRVEDTSALKLNATMSAEDAPLASIGVAVTLDGKSATKGTVTAILTSVDAQTRRVPIIAEIPNDPKAPLLAGVFVRATITSGAPIPVTKLPSSALRPGSQDEVVVVRVARAHLTHVTFARADDGALLVRDGITATDEIVLGPRGEAKDGDAVQVAKP